MIRQCYTLSYILHDFIYPWEKIQTLVDALYHLLVSQPLPPSLLASALLSTMTVTVMDS